MSDWHEDDRFWEDTAAVMFNRERMSAAAADVQAVLKLVPLPPGAAVLDLCCGPGRHSLELARTGLRVTGVDRTASYLDEARRRARDSGVEIEWVLDDMRRFRRPGAFDLALNLLTSFGYFDDPVDDRRVVENLFAGLKPGGSLVMDMMGKEILARIFRPRDWHEEPDGITLLEERAVSADWTRIDVRWIIIRNHHRAEHRFGHRLYSGIELRGLLSNIGFEDVRVFGSLDGRPYDHTAERLVAVATRPG